MTQAPCRRRTGEAQPRAEKFGDLITADHSPQWGMNPETLTGTVSWCKILPLNGFNPTRAKQKLHMRRKKRFKIIGAVAQTESCIHRQLDGILESMWRFIMESPHFNTSSIRDKRYCWKSGTKSRRRNFSRTATNRIGWTMMGWFDGLLSLSAKCPRPPGRGQNSLWKTIRRTIQRINNSFCSNGGISPDCNARPIKISWNLARQFYLEYFFGMHWSRCGTLQGDILIAVSEELERMDTSEIYPRRIIAHHREKSSCSQWQMVQRKLLGRDCESREPTLRREQAVKMKISVSLNRQNQEMTLTPEETTSFVVITMNSKFNSMCRKKKHSLLHPNTLTLQGQLILIWICYKRSGLTIIGMSIRADTCQILGKCSQCSQSSLYWKRNLQKDICGPGRDWQRFKRLPDRVMYGYKYGRKLVKPLRIDKNRNGQKKSQNFTMLEDWEEFTSSIQMTKSTKKFSKMRGEKLGRPMAPAMPCKRQSSITKVVAKLEIGSEMNSKTVYGCIVESHGSTRQRVRSPKNHEDHIAGKGFTSMSHFGAQVHPDATSNENSRCKGRSR